jgi:hypothetical protein
MTKQYSLFHRPTLNVLKDIKENMATAFRDSGLSREQLCDQMNELADRYGIHLVKGNGKQLTKATLDKWLNPRSNEHYPSPNALEVFCAAVNSVEPLKAMVDPLGWRIIGEEDARLLAWAKHYFVAKNARQQMRRFEEEK